jgi:hypothetical protein
MTKNICGRHWGCKRHGCRKKLKQIFGKPQERRKEAKMDKSCRGDRDAIRIRGEFHWIPISTESLKPTFVLSKAEPSQRSVFARMRL